ncbi:putative DNA ligase [Pseudomonas phage vB_PaeM_PAO1_Ab27]|uniref:DNA ligase n=13 Tax=Pbunavirus TaxID=1198980 RepID=A0A6G9LGV5_9CAUD|nr:putative DNA ligase [Staphylococcus aureus]YP_002154282.1 putative DNA ligase [Pseudomonas phage LMA2]YP_009124370.1 putative DNA ligase [Pseudomonas phage vB_PaeM_PAO1_Ab27]YP_009211376.1 putative DNA ligase [Pseudomonas phage vB_Pae_PS44]YP_009215179.1 putative DNA ligase [Pseudomonas phage DL68]YP_009593802.1 putative DNA ligase [Pseudomonas phage vB_PaeM_CEB_DP1]YP_009914181.1 putative DNA ligase [Pseudomonas virus Pa193]ANT44235.1 DNA ligase [Pseudomonas phage vB_Pae436M-8]QDH46067.
MKPMLASNFDPKLLEGQLPMYFSPKIDGFRCFVFEGEALTRQLKRQNNQSIYEYLSDKLFNGLDGELVCGDISDPKVFQKSSGDLRRHSGEPDWSFHVFDDFTDPRAPTEDRLARAAERVNFLRHCLGYERIHLVEQELVTSIEQFSEVERRHTMLGFEGSMGKRADGLYKFGRSTAKEGHCVKVKRYDYDEAEIIDVEELMHNNNEAFINELGHTARSSHAENLSPSGMVGAFVCRNERLWPGVTFNVSASSLTHDEKQRRWNDREYLKGQVIRFKHFSHGAKDKPRHAVFDCWLDGWGGSH